MNGSQWTIFVALPVAGAASVSAGIVTACNVLEQHDVAGTVTQARGYAPGYGVESALSVTIWGDDADGSNDAKVRLVAADLVREFDQDEALVVKVPNVTGESITREED